MNISRLAAPVLFSAFATLAPAATYTVTSLEDSGPGTLRQAIGFSLNGDRIEFDVQGTIVLTTNLVTARNITIVGPGADRLTIAPTTRTSFSGPRILQVDAGALTLSGVTIANATYGGGVGVKAKASLTMNSCEVVNCRTVGSEGNLVFVKRADVEAGFDLQADAGGEGRGGGIANYGKIVLRDCTIANCLAEGGSGGGVAESHRISDPLKPVITATGGDGGSGLGGAIYNRGEALLERCTITGNRAVGGVYFPLYSDVEGFSLQDLTPGNNSELRLGRSGMGFGGGIYTANTNLRVYLALSNCTISGNAAHGSARSDKNLLDVFPFDTGFDDGGGVYVAFTSFLLGNPPTVGGTLVAGNAASRTQAQDWRSVLTSSGYNLVGKLDGSGGFGGLDLAGTNASPIDPGLSPLGYFGGTTRVMALPPGSPAIDRGKSFSGGVDGRGRPRRFDFPSVPNQIGGDSSDIGAFEVQAPLHVDADLDGKADLVLQRQNSIRFFRLQGDTLLNLDLPPLASGLRILCAGRLFPDGALGLAFYDPAAQKLRVLRTERNEFVSSGNEPLPTGFTPAATADFNRDGIEDFLLFAKTSRATQIRFWSGGFTGSPRTGPTLPPGYLPVGCGDFNQDTKPDIVVYNSAEKKLLVLLMNGANLLSTVNLPKPESGFVPVAVDDYNSDGNADLLFYRETTRATRIFFMNRAALGRAADGTVIPSGFSIVGLIGNG